MSKRALAQQQRIEVFAQAIVEGKSQADAYREAFPGSRKWTPKALHTRASAYAASKEVVRRVQELRARALERHDATVRDLAAHWSEVLRMDPVELVDEQNRPRQWRDIPAKLRRCIAKYEIGPGGAFKVRFVDRLKASEQLARHLGAFGGAGHLPPTGVRGGVDIGDASHGEVGFPSVSDEEASRVHQEMMEYSRSRVGRVRGRKSSSGNGE